ncbi:hypothetical protein [Arcobacter sp. LA11]|uniref:hypothetical protein n=1 Tax=Arcobacter sp. LA11 TaxID=1898176 RepID=UPI0009332C0A|nr:hypothetical protein [Arcobacter sp. LA11]
MKKLLKEDIQILEEKLIQNQISKEEFTKTFIFFSYLFYKGVRVVFQYPGSKQKMKVELNYIFEKLYLEKIEKTGKSFDIFIDGFAGAMNSTIVLMDSLILSGVKKVIVNDINPCLVQVHDDIRNNSEALISEYSEIIRTKYIKKYGGLILRLEQYEQIHFELNEKFMQLQKNNQFGIRTSVIFLLLQGVMFSGIPKYDNSEGARDTDFKFTYKVYDIERYHSVLFNQIPKIRQFSKIYNQVEIEFRNQDFFEILDEFKGNPNVLFNLDVPYIQEGKKILSEEHLSNMTSRDLEDCVINYNLYFDHLKIIKELENINFIYNNNAHPILNYYANKFDIEVGDFIRKEVTSNKLNGKVKDVKELILFKNSLLHKPSNLNNTDYSPSQLVA